MKKRILSIVLAIMMIATIVPMGVLSVGAEDVDSGYCGGEGDGTNLSWALDDQGKLTISGTGKMADFDWNSSPWHSYKDEITEVLIENGVTSVGGKAFYDYAGLTKVTIPQGVISIGDWSLCGNGLTSINIPNSVTSIEEGAFWGCAGLTSIDIPDSVTSIGIYAFADCSSLASITIHNSVTSIEEDVFNRTDYYNDESNWDNGVLYIGKYLIKADNEKDISGEYTIKEGTTVIVGRAFEYCSNLTSVIMPNSLVLIGNDAFVGCSSLISINIPDGVTSIGESAFQSCSSLTSINIPDGVTSIGDGAFMACRNLTSINLPNGITSIGVTTFCASGLTSVTIPDGVTSIGSTAFYNCSDLASITIPDSVTSIGGSAFTGTAYYNEPTNWDNDVLYIGKFLIKAKEDISGDYIIKEGTKVISSGAFQYCRNLTNIYIPDGVTSIGEDAFWGCKSLSVVIIPDGVTSIENSSFNACTGLTSIYIPDSITSIGAWAFYSCESLNDVYYLGTEEQWNNISIGECNDSLTNATIHYSHHKYKVIFKNEDGEILGERFVEDGIVTAPEMPEVEGKTLNWYLNDEKIDLSTLEINDNIILVGKYDTNKYKVTFLDYDETKLKEEEVNYGEAALAPADPEREGYVFTGWDKAFNDIKADLEITAQYLKKCTVTFLDYDWTVIDTQIVNPGEDAVKPTDPARTGYAFTGWDKSFKNVTSDLTIIAQYDAIPYTIRFEDGNGNLIDQQTITYDYYYIHEPNAPQRTGYTFVGWDKDLDNIISDLTVNPVYRINEYTVTFKVRTKIFGGELDDYIMKVEHGKNPSDVINIKDIVKDTGNWFFRLLCKPTGKWTNKNGYVVAKVLEDNITLYAQYKLFGIFTLR